MCQTDIDNQRIGFKFIVFPRQNPTGPRYNKASKNSNWNRSAKHIYGGQSHRPKIQIIVNTGCDR